MLLGVVVVLFFFFKQKTAYEMRISDWSSDVCSSDLDRKTGAIQLAGNRYWAPELVELAGQAVTIRFDPEQLHAPIHVYDRAGRFLVTADRKSTRLNSSH